jgi:D-amino-acid dehydrogenase
LLRELEPAISREIQRAVLLPQNRSIRDPCKLVTELAQQVRERNGGIETGEVVDFDRSGDAIAGVVLADGRRLAASEVVIAAGAWSAKLSRALGEPMPLETERGYHTQIIAPGVSLAHAIIWPARAFMVTPTAGGLRVGGTVEMAGLDAPPDYRRAKVLVRRAREALPDLKTEGASEWMGHRPAFPDTVPVISASCKTQGLYYATGHGHLGLTYAATTARLIGDLVTGATPPIDMTPYRVDRF